MRHKTTQNVKQTVEMLYIVEGPDSHGRYTVTGPSGLSSTWQLPGQFIVPEYNEAVALHIESLPKSPTVMNAYLALNDAAREVGYNKPNGHPLHDHTPLSRDEAITLMELLNKIIGGSQNG